MTIVINLGFVIIACWVIMKVNYSVIQKTKLNTFRFRLFALRDEFAVGAMNGIIPADSFEYRRMISLINSTIAHAKTLDPFTLAQFFMKAKESCLIAQLEDKKRFENRCEELAFLKEIYTSYLEISRDIFNFNLPPKIVFIIFKAMHNVSAKARKWMETFESANEFLKSREILAGDI
jgi:hypothetical protein